MKKILLTISLVIMFILGACTSTKVIADQSNPLKIWYHNENGYTHTWQLVDEDTEVNYIVVTTERGNGEMAIAITPRLNADGSLYVS